MRTTTKFITPDDGGRLVTILPLDQIGPRNYAEKVNWRRLDGKEYPREGWLAFAPNSGLPAGPQQTFPGECRGLWEAVRPNGETAIVGATATALYRFRYSTGAWEQIGSGFVDRGLRWQADSIDGYLVLNNPGDLPVTYRVEDNAVAPLKELREVGVVACGSIAVFNNFLILADVTEIISTQLATWMNGATPYGAVPDNITQRVKYRVMWSDLGKPTNFAPLIKGTIQSASKDQVTLEFPCSAFSVGAKVAVIGAGVGGGTLGGTTGYEDGVPITAVSGSTITLALPANASLTYPLSVTVTRWSDVSTFAGYQNIKDDSSAILKVVPLKRRLIVLRETGIFTARFTGSSENPFQFGPEYRGADVPEYPECVFDLNGDALVYPTKNRWVVYDGAGDPGPYAPLDNCRNLFFDGLPSQYRHRLYAAKNPVTREVYVGAPTRTLAVSFVDNAVNPIDEIYGGVTYGRYDSGAPRWFLQVVGTTVARYGATEQGALTFLRGGAAYTNKLAYGALSPVGLNHTVLRSHYVRAMPVTYESSVTPPSTAPTVSVKVYGSERPLGPYDLLIDETIDALNSEAAASHFSNLYFKDELSWVAPFVLTDRVLEAGALVTQNMTVTDIGNA